jgi:hypothetical protein
MALVLGSGLHVIGTLTIFLRVGFAMEFLWAGNKKNAL